jgi:DNA processing protein
MEELIALQALSRIPTLTGLQKKWVVETYDSIAHLFTGRSATPDSAIGSALRSFHDFKKIDAEMAKLSRMGVTIVTIRDEAYPPQLKQIPDPPVVLYKKGPLPLALDSFAVVGARNASFEGMILAERIAETLSSVGIVVTSGLARGVDAAAHKGAIRQKGKTIGVLGCGIDRCYPAENLSLFEGIGKEGALVTEYALGMPPLKHHFPERNRIIAGLSKAVLVVEASARSGSLITARFALEYGREVMAIPGRVFDEAHKGTNNLIKQGARLVEDIADIITVFPDARVKKKSAIDMDGDEAYIYTLMGTGSLHVDEIIQKSRFETRNVMATLTRLEMKDLVDALPGGFYIRKAND